MKAETLLLSDKLRAEGYTSDIIQANLSAYDQCMRDSHTDTLVGLHACTHFLCRPKVEHS